jgi:hypothetical protein
LDYPWVQRCGEFGQWGDLRNLGEAALSAVITFATISAIGGLVLGFYCVPWPLIVIPNLIIAIVSVIMSLHQNLSFLAAVALFFGCLSLNQICYVIGAAFTLFSEDSKTPARDQADSHPGES